MLMRAMIADAVKYRVGGLKCRRSGENSRRKIIVVCLFQPKSQQRSQQLDPARIKDEEQ
jgi:hypothetical protein